MTGTPLDLTPFGSIVTGIGWLYWLLAFGLLVLAVRRPKTLLRKALWSLLVVAVFGVMPAIEIRDAYAAQARLKAAQAHFEMRCKGAGEKITRTVPDVAGVVWMKWRKNLSANDEDDQFKLSDPYGRDCTEQECIEQLLRLDTKTGRFEREVGLRKGRYRFVESVDPVDGRRYRYVGTMKPGRSWTAEAIEAHRKTTGAEIPDTSYQFQLEKNPIDKFTARYGVTWDDISTREDREHWIAGGSIKVIDLQNNEVIAERVGYMMDRGLGSTAGFRSPWGLAQQYACPEFQTIGPTDPRRSRGAENRRFITQVLQPSKGE